MSAYFWPHRLHTLIKRPSSAQNGLNTSPQQASSESGEKLTSTSLRPNSANRLATGSADGVATLSCVQFVSIISLKMSRSNQVLRFNFSTRLHYFLHDSFVVDYGNNCNRYIFTIRYKLLAINWIYSQFKKIVHKIGKIIKKPAKLFTKSYKLVTKPSNHWQKYDFRSNESAKAGFY